MSNLEEDKRHLIYGGMFKNIIQLQISNVLRLQHLYLCRDKKMKPLFINPNNHSFKK